ncbi:MAG: hypothetical protein A3C70_02980 [Candidatus Zambryskibacteria bacterium RIFCSPHIGHO2_02_FULL_43_14]|uniref:Transposase IS200-like domain-containing protein n=1 Tax=Candidatus Zambryskibacteria bacterium RIFCSPHIGHO2_02_FULL_43_14 TaxID=1802748 RepID=A0A1G2TF65_9BACT|nr:MAG: hypothetical protein A2829_00495 [Candidatus Zambryskibacteria bacterium RIFCSPHIGHO2_01_FULL_43_60]OHA95945.1 MAG: hypothetical protein A3C70_02980 [Candidatus Zambryskibacteria bacterium RIFCSPHIGHO2_02_FULL_43_14]OHB03639.1 MAG: hypothetical protein A3B03_02885 [Candidatus Zambryskibacteria bacterium RIFCSPLOWO2_01_FULL_42_41]
MKNRDFKQFARDSIQHVYNRGDNRENIFRDEEDYRAFIYRLGLGLGFEADELNKHPLSSISKSRIRITKTNKDNFRLHAFSLIPNHFHLLIEQCTELPISSLILKVCTSYAMFINKKYKRVGHIFQDQYKSVLIKSHPQLMWIPGYIHMNSVEAGIVKHPADYKWSSYNDYVSDRGLPITHTKFLLETFEGKKGFEKTTLDALKDMSRVSRVTLDMWGFHS